VLVGCTNWCTYWYYSTDVVPLTNTMGWTCSPINAHCYDRFKSLCAGRPGSPTAVRRAWQSGGGISGRRCSVGWHSSPHTHGVGRHSSPLRQNAQTNNPPDYGRQALGFTLLDCSSCNHRSSSSAGSGGRRTAGGGFCSAGAAATHGRVCAVTCGTVHITQSIAARIPPHLSFKITYRTATCKAHTSRCVCILAVR
jgi:hypothetical protein